ncbi:MAG: hypothetical protein K8T91_08930 [Planctomycetes bacterium]|nr:hypothetical protein [Planctomycetota bacterium]
MVMVFAIILTMVGCTCSSPTDTHQVQEGDKGANTGGKATDSDTQASQRSISNGGQAGIAGGSAPGGDASSNPLGPAHSQAGLPPETSYPKPIVGQAIRLDKPVQQPQPGYLIIPDDKPADLYMIGFPGDDEVKAFIMAGTNLSDTGLAQVPKFAALHTLDASGTRVTDRGLRSLERAQVLQTLNLRNTAVTDGGVRSLMQIRTLKSVELTGTKVTPQGIEELHKARPDIQIVY